MSRIRAKDTKPEMVVRRLLHGAGFRYRLNDRRLPGTPDLVLPKYRAVIFIHGCFWHRHHCPLFHWPKSRQEFWVAKLTRNVERDQEASKQLLEAGWRVLTVWECALRGQGRLPSDVVIDQIRIWLAGAQVTGDLRSQYYSPEPLDND
ncbi:DNA mismatch endonuclease vsr (plasmid) [Deinococcus gobiensis I-0]|uniref:DNA mismatch endonuclease vsr n=2 Tax=Deinococcus TaxID=1298 RepID=H8H3L0_DEIGI|nr:DNA mismatch endonuclease vsr [Deinococcus gobiensis I-0]